VKQAITYFGFTVQSFVGNGPSIFAPSYSGLNSGNLANSDQQSFSTLDLLYLMKLCQYENDYNRKIQKLNLGLLSQNLARVACSQGVPINSLKF